MDWVCPFEGYEATVHKTSFSFTGIIRLPVSHSGFAAQIFGHLAGVRFIRVKS